MTALSSIGEHQQHLAAELRRIRNLLQAAAGVPVTEDVDCSEDVAGEDGGDSGEAPIVTLAAACGLTRFERDLLLLAAGAEMDAQIGALCAAVNGQSGARFATFGLALTALPGAHWTALTPDGPLRKFRLASVAPGRSLVTAPFRVEERVLHYLTGVNDLDLQLRPIVRRVPAVPLAPQLHIETARRIADVCRRADADWPVVQLWGDDAEGQMSVAAEAAALLGLSLYAVRSDDLPPTASERWVFLTLWAREARLLGSALLIQNVPVASRRFIVDAVETLGPPLFIAGSEPLDLAVTSRVFEVSKPDAAERALLWTRELGALAGPLADDLDVVAAQYRIGSAAIGRMSAAVRHETAEGTDPRSALHAACRSRANQDLDGLAQRIVVAATWNDIVLPPDALKTLREIAAQVRHRTTVYERWGFGARGTRGLGISALFAGVSGTGKTMAAEVLAGELGLDLYRIDLSAVISKYLGETEKNLRRVFDAADDAGVILFFDEADALFGKRSEVRDSHDRYANVEISYLLQRMETYRGLAILASNMRQSLDSAFLRRLRFIVNFPFPDHSTRREIWERALPAAMPRAAVDLSRLARLNIAGGNIRNIALNAAFAAAEQGEAVAMVHLLHAARREYAKVNRVLTDAETTGWTP
jgi:hypothetical protein